MDMEVGAMYRYGRVERARTEVEWSCTMKGREEWQTKGGLEVERVEGLMKVPSRGAVKNSCTWCLKTEDWL